MRIPHLDYDRIRKMLFTFVYIVESDYVIHLGENAPKYTGSTPFIKYDNGKLIVKKGFAWDGPSGPSIDTKAFILASLVHDSLYKLMAYEVIKHTEENRLFADNIMRQINLSLRMWRFRAFYTWLAVRIFGRFNVKKRGILRIEGNI